MCEPCLVFSHHVERSKHTVSSSQHKTSASSHRNTSSLRKPKLTTKQTKQTSIEPQRPTSDDKEAWRSYWEKQGQPWRTEPEIDKERQKYLDKRRDIVPDIEQGIYPFKDIKLSREDVEWLLATNENGRGPVDWSDQKSLNGRDGLDLRGANLQQLNLNGLPLTALRAGLSQDERNVATVEQGEVAAAHLERASLKQARLERAIFSRAHLEQADLRRVHLERATLSGAHLENTILRHAHLE